MQDVQINNFNYDGKTMSFVADLERFSEPSERKGDVSIS